MQQLVYVSTARPNFHRAEVGDILAVSRHNNALADVTGLLVYDGVRFLQALEGGAEAVDAVFARIGKDPRHRSIVVLAKRTVAAREFGAWSMAAEQIPEVSKAGSITDVVDAMVESIDNPSERERFRSFIRLRHKEGPAS